MKINSIIMSTKLETIPFNDRSIQKDSVKGICSSQEIKN